MDLNEKRRWIRQAGRLPVSMKCHDQIGHSRSWHVGEIIDVSVKGMKILSETLGEIPTGSRFELLCFPRDNFPPYEIDDPEPVWLEGEVVWQDTRACMVGLRLIS